MVIQVNNLRTDYTTKKPITTFIVIIKKLFNEYYFDVVIKWNQIPEYCENPDEVACQQIMIFLSTNKNYKKINSSELYDFHYIAYFNKINKKLK